MKGREKILREYREIIQRRESPGMGHDFDCSGLPGFAPKPLFSARLCYGQEGHRSLRENDPWAAGFGILNAIVAGSYNREVDT